MTHMTVIAGDGIQFFSDSPAKDMFALLLILLNYQNNCYYRIHKKKKKHSYAARTSPSTEFK